MDQNLEETKGYLMPTLALIACGKNKLTFAAPGEKLYQGELFKKSLAWAKTFADKILILSALHGPVELDQMIEPYNVTLTHGMRKSDKVLFRNKCHAVFENYKGWDFVYLAGANYRHGLPKGAAPMEGMAIGKQLQFLCNKLKELRE